MNMIYNIIGKIVVLAFFFGLAVFVALWVIQSGQDLGL